MSTDAAHPPAGAPAGRPWKTATLGGFASYMDSATIVAGGTAWVLYQDSLNLGPWDIGALSAILTFALAVGWSAAGSVTGSAASGSSRSTCSSSPSAWPSWPSRRRPPFSTSAW